MFLSHFSLSSLGNRLDVFVYQTSSSRTIYTGAGQIGLAAVRVDGTAAIVGEGTTARVVDLKTGAATTTNLSASVCLRPVLLP